MRRPWPTEGCRAKNKQTITTTIIDAMQLVDFDAEKGYSLYEN